MQWHARNCYRVRHLLRLRTRHAQQPLEFLFRYVRSIFFNEAIYLFRTDRARDAYAYAENLPRFLSSPYFIYAPLRLISLFLLIYSYLTLDFQFEYSRKALGMEIFHSFALLVTLRFDFSLEYSRTSCSFVSIDLLSHLNNFSNTYYLYNNIEI